MNGSVDVSTLKLAPHTDSCNTSDASGGLRVWKQRRPSYADLEDTPLLLLGCAQLLKTDLVFFEDGSEGRRIDGAAVFLPWQVEFVKTLNTRPDDGRSACSLIFWKACLDLPGKLIDRIQIQRSGVLFPSEGFGILRYVEGRILIVQKPRRQTADGVGQAGVTSRLGRLAPALVRHVASGLETENGRRIRAWWIRSRLVR